MEFVKGSRSRWPATEWVSGLRPEIEKNRGFGASPENKAKNSKHIGKWPPENRVLRPPFSFFFRLLFSYCPDAGGRNLYFPFFAGKSHPWTNTSVGETLEELSGPLVHTNFGGNSYGPIIGPYLFLGKFLWTNGPESSSKVSPYTGIGPWMALPCKNLLLFQAGGPKRIATRGQRSILLKPPSQNPLLKTPF